MTAGSYMYIGPQGIVHGTAITILSAGPVSLGLEPMKALLKGVSRRCLEGHEWCAGKSSRHRWCRRRCRNQYGSATKRHEQGWVDELYTDLETWLLGGWKKHESGSRLYRSRVRRQRG